MTLMDFAVLPPEVNSGRIYAGPRSGPLMAAAAAWDGLAAELSSATASYQGAVSDLTEGSWQGPSATAMAAAAAPYVAWMGTTAAQAEQAANQARAAAAAYEAAFAATVPPPVIAANRTLLASLVASNLLGQNIPAIAANQAEYAEMWAQDATAMYGYAASSAVATQLTPFTAPAQNTSPAGAGAQAAAAAQSGLATAPNAVQNLASGAAASSPLPSWLDQLLNFNLATTQLGQDFLAVNGSFSGFQAVVGGLGYTASGSMFTIVPGVNAAIAASTAMSGAMAAASAVPVSAVTVAPGMGTLGSTLAGSYASGAGVSAGLAQAGSVGGLSVPPSWTATAPTMAAASPGARLAAAALPNAGIGGAPGAGLAGTGPMMGGMPMVAGGVNAPRTGEPNSRFGSRLKVLPHLGGESGAQENPSTRWTQPNQPAAKAGGKFTERDELKELRRAVAELAKERDVLHGAAVSLLKEATQR